MISAAQAADVLSACESDALTGLVELVRAPEVQVVVLFVEGLVLDAYRIEQDASQKVEPTALNLPPGEVTVRTLSLPLEGVRMAKVLLEWHPPVESLTVQTSSILGCLQNWSAQPTTSVVHIAWADAEAMVILPGGVLPASALFVEESRVLGDAAGLDAIYAHAEGACRLARYAAQRADIAEQEQITRLRTAFGLLVDPLIVRYAELLGQSMANALLLDLNGAAAAYNWRIKFTTNGLMDTQTFKIPQEAVQAYTTLWGKLLDHMTVVIGARLTSSLVAQAFGGLGPQFQQALRVHGLIADAQLAAKQASKR